jgi:hypothetical protein
MTIPHPTNSDLVFEAEYFPAEKKQGEYQYSLGSPPIQEKYEITAVSWRGIDVTDFVVEFCDNLFPKWEEDLLD